MSVSKFYHITDFPGMIRISSEGIKADREGNIYVLDEKNIAGCVAANQLLLSNYGLFEIDSTGVTGTIKSDNVAEITSQHQFIIHQSLIEVKFIRFLGMFKTLGIKHKIE